MVDHPFARDWFYLHWIEMEAEPKASGNGQNRRKEGREMRKSFTITAEQKNAIIVWCSWSWACCVFHLHLQWYTLVDADHQIRVHNDHQIRVHGDHQEEISSGDWSRSSIHQIWHWLPPQYATVVIWSNLPDRQTCKTMSKLTQTKRLQKNKIYTLVVYFYSSCSGYIIPKFPLVVWCFFGENSAQAYFWPNFTIRPVLRFLSSGLLEVSSNNSRRELIAETRWGLNQLFSQIQPPQSAEESHGRQRTRKRDVRGGAAARHRG